MEYKSPGKCQKTEQNLFDSLGEAIQNEVIFDSTCGNALVCSGMKLLSTNMILNHLNFKHFLLGQVISAAPSSQTVDDESDLGVIDNIVKKIQEVKEQIKCAINVIGKVVRGSDLEKKYVEFKTAVNTVLNDNLKACGQARGIKDKVRYVE